MRGSWTAVAVGIIGLAIATSGLDAAPPATRPIEGLRDNTPRVHALVDARVSVGPGKWLEKATIVIRDGLIAAVGEDVKPPADAVVHDLSGHTIYAGFIDALAEQPLPDELRSSAPYWNSLVVPQMAMADHWKPDGGRVERLLAQGVTAELVAPLGGIWKGTSVLVATGEGEPNRLILNPRVAQHLKLTLSRGSRRLNFPNSPMGAVALARQAMLDAAWYESAWQAHRTQPNVPAPEHNDALAALNSWTDQQGLVIADASDEQFALRADQFAREFNLRLAIRGSGREYARVEAIRALDRTLIIPVAFPRPPQVSTAESAANVALEDLLHWDYAPENPARLEKAGVRFAFTLSGLKEPRDLWPAVRKAVRRGLTPPMALAAMTTIPAELFGVGDRLGTIESGRYANLVVADGDLFTNPDSQITQTWVLGNRHEVKRPSTVDVNGRWKVTHVSGSPLPASDMVLEFRRKKDELEGAIEHPPKTSPQTPKVTDEGTAAPTGSETPTDAPSGDSSKKKGKKKQQKQKQKKKPEAADTPPATAASADTTPPTESPAKSSPPEPVRVPLQSLAVRDGRLAALLETEKWGQTGKAQLSALALANTVESLSLRGEFTWPDGSTTRFTAHREQAPAAGTSAPAVESKDATPPSDQTASRSESPTPDQKKSEKPSAPASFPLVFPLSAFGRGAPPDRPAVVFFKDATIWTCGPMGVLENASLLVRDGKIEAVGHDLAPPAGAIVVDCRGRHLSPGIIDCHSHMATDGGINESSQSVTAEVRIGDFIDATDVNIYRQLAGGVTSSHILHGSANTIGGQCQVIKLRWGDLPEQLKFREAPPTIKFALGENVKQSNWDRNTGRYPQSRMGVDEVVRDAFAAARQYMLDHERWERTREGLPPRRDLELDALAEILQQKRWIHCHSYRQDEILALLRTLEGFGIRVQTLQHILEGYKVADAMKKHGATGSSFSDWWAYKFEVIDAIPYNGSLMHNAGVVVSFNSDDRELARHLNHEAAKAVKYGGVPPVEALKFVTLNPAIQLHIDRWVGSLEPGKDADLVVWSSSPLSTMSRCEQTWVDGRRYFDRDEDKQLRRRAAEIRASLVQKILASGETMREAGESYVLEREQWVRHDEFCGASGRGQ